MAARAGHPATAPRALPGAAPLARHAHRLALAAVLGLAALLNLWRLDQNGWGNSYYTAAVASMQRSLSNLVFASFDAGGLQSVDKPPLALWVQAASVRLFGLSHLAVLLPGAIAGVAAVGLLYLVVARGYGRLAGLVAATALAVSPALVAVSRVNGPDPLLVLVLVAALWAALRAIESGALRWAFATGVLLGLGFETKMAMALIVVPGLAIAYLILPPASLGRRLGGLAVALAALVVVGGAWLAVVALVPSGERPWIGGTSDDSALSLLLDYNGIGRVAGQEGGTSTGGGGILMSGAPGLFRLVTGTMGSQGGWLVPLALAGAVVGIGTAIAARDRRRLAVVVPLAGWLLVGGALLSVASGIVHAYYVAVLAPAVAGLVGITVGVLRERPPRWAVAVASLGVAGTVLVQVRIVERGGYLPWLVPAVTAAVVLGALAWALLGDRPAWRPVALVAVAAALLFGPAAWARTTSFAPVSGVSPGAGPDAGLGGSVRQGRGGPGGGPGQGGAPPGGGFGGGLSAGSGPGGGIFGRVDGLDAALAYAGANGATARFPLLVQSQEGVADDVIAGSRVAAIGGFSGRESAMSAESITRLVERGEARYVLLQPLGGLGGGDTRGTSAATTLVESSCSVVPASAWADAGASSATLYDCAGLAG